MKTELYYFTGTGNGLHIAKSIKKIIQNVEQEVNLIPINTLNLSKKIKTSAERVGIIFPTYALSAPAIVKSFANQLQVSNNSYVFLYAHSGGGGASGSLYSINQILSKNGVKISNTFETTFPSNSVLLTYTSGKLDNVLEKADVSLKNNINSIINKESRHIPKPNVFKNVSATLTKKIAAAGEKMMQFKVITPDDACNGCSTCQRVCPVENIELKNGKPVFGKNCEMCMSCVNQCPKKSLAYGKMKKKKLLSYRHPEVQLKELMYR